MSTVLVAAAGRAAADDPAALWSALRHAAADVAGQRMIGLSGVAGVEVRAIPAEPVELERALDTAIADGATELAVLPVDVVVEPTAETGGPVDRDLSRLAAVVAGVAARHPALPIRSVGPPFDPVVLGAVVDLLGGTPPAGHGVEGAVPAVLERAFGADPAVLASFLAALRAGLPPTTAIALRGSSVAGQSYTTGQPFDARGPASSDLDVVVLGDEAMAMWDAGAFFFPGVNTLPLSDDARWVAPRLDPARTEAQAIVGRPVSVQAMAPWFLDVRAAFQGQPYLVLHAPS
jgi:hypothetical protein